MDSSIAALTAQPRPFDHDGRTYLVHPLRVSDYGQMQAWCDAKQPNPFKAVSEQLGTGLFTVAQEKALLEAAVRVSRDPRPRIGSPECDALIGSIEGIAKIVHISVSKGDPKFTEAAALDLVGRLDDARAQELMILLGFDSLIGGEEGGDEGPKARPGGACSTPP